MDRFSDNKNKKEQLDNAEFIRESLQSLHKGDPRLIDDSLKRFLEDGQLSELIGRLDILKAQIYGRWLELGFGTPPQEALEEELYSEEPVVVELDMEQEGEEKDETLTGDPQDGGDEAEDEIQLEIVDEIPAGNEEKVPTEGDGEMEEGDSEVGEMPDVKAEKKVNVPIRLKLDLPNGKVGTKYLLEIPVECYRIDTSRIKHYDTQGFRDSGLKLDSETWTISGMPAHQGQLDLSITMDYDAGEGKTGKVILEGSCYINPDPRSLWQEKEPEPDAPYFKSHTDVQRIELEEQTLLGASRRGRAHAHKGGFRDDDFFLGKSEDGWITLAVADGAGSADFSREGSRIACHLTGDRLLKDLNSKFTEDIFPLIKAHYNGDEAAENTIKLLLNDVLVGAIFDSYKAISREAEGQDKPAKHYATTLLFSIARKFGQKWFLATYWVGDGAIAAYKQGEWVKILGQGDSGEFAGQTRFLTMPELWQDQQSMLSRLTFDILDDFTALVLMTDGVSDPKLQTDYNMQQVERWDELWADLGNEVDLSPDNEDADGQLLEWLNFWSQGDHDDRTIAFMLQGGEA